MLPCGLRPGEEILLEFPHVKMSNLHVVLLQRITQLMQTPKLHQHTGCHTMNHRYTVHAENLDSTLWVMDVTHLPSLIPAGAGCHGAAEDSLRPPASTHAEAAG